MLGHRRGGRHGVAGRRLAGLATSISLFLVVSGAATPTASAGQAFGTTSVDPSPDLNMGVTPSPGDVAFRQEFGLRSDSAWVASVDAAPDADRTYGVALTTDEANGLRTRDSISNQIGPLTDALEQTGSFGGLFIDQAAGGVIDIATTSDPASLTSVINAGVPAGATTRTRVVQFTYDELSALKSRISSDFDVWKEKGAILASVGVDVRENRVAVSVAGTNDDATLSEIAVMYGPEVQVTAGELPVLAACVDRTNCGSPLKGGLWVSAPGWACTATLQARSSSAPYQHYGMTAGHCINDAGISATWSHHSTAIGSGAFNGFYNNSLADIGLFWASSQPTPRNLVYASSHLDIRNITGELTDAQQPVGAQICKSGANSGWLCGQVTATNVDTTYGSVRIFDTWRTNFGGLNGDSGGTMMNNITSIGGVLSGFVGSSTIYSTIDNVKLTVGIVPCYTAACP